MAWIPAIVRGSLRFLIERHASTLEVIANRPFVQQPKRVPQSDMRLRRILPQIGNQHMPGVDLSDRLEVASCLSGSGSVIPEPSNRRPA